MLFNSLSFLLLYAPITIAAYYLLGARSPRAACGWLGLMSLVFYAWWYPPHVLILLVSICFNFFLGIAISRAGSDPARKRALIFALAMNLLALCYYKYFGFFGASAATALGLQWRPPAIALPLGISFFTFTQIAYLADTYQRKVEEHDFPRYLLFVTYFPHLVAGPIIHHKAVMSQFAVRQNFRFNDANFVAGVVMFILGLFKKIVLADNVALLATPVFTLADQGAALSTQSAWIGALAYTLQLYFDFSGYSDMAIGLSLMLNVRLPFNFDSPYKARSIIDFWRRWHISLSTFLRDYLYIPLGGNRHGKARRHLNMGLTMLLGGLWHGAGWTFLIWGALHGLYLGINHMWRERTAGRAFVNTAWYSACAWILTLAGVIVAWVFFRAQSVQGAFVMLEGMAGLSGVASAQLPIGAGESIGFTLAWCAVLPLLAISLWAPNSQEITAGLLADGSQFAAAPGAPEATLSWRGVPLASALLLGAALASALASISRPTQFLYFNF